MPIDAAVETVRRRTRLSLQALGVTPTGLQWVHFGMAALSSRRSWREYGRTPLYDPRLPFMVFYSQKGACTAIVKWYFQKLGVLEGAGTYRKWIHAYENDVFKKRSGYNRERYAAD
ncbi:MAG: hypothetical protein AAF224_09330 [Pseudomonadota bacterium]